MFEERFVEADGFSIRYLEATAPPGASRDGPLVCFHGAGGLRLSRAHELLTASRRVIAFELPGFGASPVNERSASIRDLARTMLRATELGIARFDLWGQSFGGLLALRLAAEDPDRLAALVLSSPAAIRLGDGKLPPPSELGRLLHAHPERRLDAAPLPADVDTKQRELVGRLVGPLRDAELEDAMRTLEVPTLVLLGTEDRLTPPELGRRYRELLPDCHFVLVYDAAHAIYDDRPEAFATLVADFLAHREEFVVRRESGLLYP